MHGLTATQLNNLAAANLDALDVTGLTTTQVAGLNTTAIQQPDHHPGVGADLDRGGAAERQPSSAR